MNVTSYNLAAGRPYRVEAVRGPVMEEQTQLTDGLRASLDPNDAQWVRFTKGTTRGIIIDLGAEKSVERVSIRFLQVSDQKMFFPAVVSLFASADGLEWGLAAHIPSKMQVWHAGPPHDQFYVWEGQTDGLRTGDGRAGAFAARYVKITFTSDLNLMTDGLEVWGTDEMTQATGRTAPCSLAYMQPGEHSAGIRDLMLLYNGYYKNGSGNWEKDDMIPYISYVDEQGNPIDWMFDGVLHLGLISPSGLSFEVGSADVVNDWKWYLDKTFAAGGDLDQLNEATKEVAGKIGPADKRTKVVLMLPNPGVLKASFEVRNGELTAYDGGELSMAGELEMKLMLLRWYVDQLESRWSAKGYAHLELSGIYWLSEGVSVDIPLEDSLIRSVGDLVHERGYRFYWIPYFYGGRSFDWQELNFDAAVLQPNHFFNDTEEERIEDTAVLAKLYGMGIEMEFDERMNEDPAYRRKYIEYLNGGVLYGYMTDTFKGYYQGNRALLNSARSTNPANRQLYDWMYQFVKGTYTIQVVE